MESITCELNGIKYLLIECLVMDSNQEQFNARAKKYDCIIQGFSKLVTGGFFTSSYMVIKLLVPESNIIAYNNEVLNEKSND